MEGELKVESCVGEKVEEEEETEEKEEGFQKVMDKGDMKEETEELR